MVRLLSLNDALKTLSLNDAEPDCCDIEVDDEFVGADSLRQAAQSVRDLRRQTTLSA